MLGRRYAVQAKTIAKVPRRYREVAMGGEDHAETIGGIAGLGREGHGGNDAHGSCGIDCLGGDYWTTDSARIAAVSESERSKRDWAAVRAAANCG